MTLEQIADLLNIKIENNKDSINLLTNKNLANINKGIAKNKISKKENNDINSIEQDKESKILYQMENLNIEDKNEEQDNWINIYEEEYDKYSGISIEDSNKDMNNGIDKILKNNNININNNQKLKENLENDNKDNINCNYQHK